MDTKKCIKCGEDSGDSETCFNCRADSYLGSTKRKKFVKTDSVNSQTNIYNNNNSKYANSVKNRYWDAYLIAKVTNGYGRIIKIIGIFLGILLLLIGLISLSDVFDGNQNRIYTVIGFLTIILGIVIGAFFYIVGVLVSAQGQILKASVDNAVNNSPFLDDDEKAKVMSL